MTTKSKLAFAAATVAMMLSGPAFAQSTDHTGTLQPSYYDVTGKQVMGSWTPSGSAGNKPTVQPRPLYNSAKDSVKNRPLYNSAVTPVEFGGAASGYDPSAASQR
jgi:hypothetical protein